MYQAITTRFLAPTNTKGPRVVATALTGRHVVDYDQSKGIEANHTRAAKLFAEHFFWEGRWVGGSTNGGYVFVCDNTGDTDSAYASWDAQSPRRFDDGVFVVFPPGHFNLRKRRANSERGVQ